MSHKPDRATAERNTRTLRELVKRPENKVCSDCKRNDPRWASWNLGVFLCIRCSGIHRGMGTHISKVKSVDLDAWTPEQMDSIQKWGNKRANLYWEAHLKAGHIPPEHKMESFIRSKYESRRWAMEGPLPSDPSVLEGGGSASPVPEPQAIPAPAGLSYEQHLQHQQRQPVAAPPVPTHTHVSSRSQGHQLLSSAYTQNARNQAPALVAVPAPVQPAQQAPAPVPASAAQDLFSLDFHTPSPSATPSAQVQQQQPKKDVKHDIMSLFSAAPAQTPVTASFSAFSTPAVTNVWGGHPVPQNLAAAQPQATSMMGAASWGASSAWGAPQAPQQPFATTNAWGAPAAAPAVPAAQSSFFSTSDVWGSSGSAAPAAAPPNDLFGGFASNSGAAPTTAPAKKDDVFGDIWGGFK